MLNRTSLRYDYKWMSDVGKIIVKLKIHFIKTDILELAHVPRFTYKTHSVWRFSLYL